MTDDAIFPTRFSQLGKADRQLTKLTVVVTVLLFLASFRASNAFVARATISRGGKFVMGVESEENPAEDFTSDLPGGISSSFKGAGRPRVELKPQEIPSLLMEAL